jgi:hypothetical protein
MVGCVRADPVENYDLASGPNVIWKGTNPWRFDTFHFTHTHTILNWMWLHSGQERAASDERCSHVVQKSGPLCAISFYSSVTSVQRLLNSCDSFQSGLAQNLPRCWDQPPFLQEIPDCNCSFRSPVKKERKKKKKLPGPTTRPPELEKLVNISNLWRLRMQCAWLMKLPRCIYVQRRDARTWSIDSNPRMCLVWSVPTAAELAVATPAASSKCGWPPPIVALFGCPHFEILLRQFIPLVGNTEVLPMVQLVQSISKSRTDSTCSHWPDFDDSLTGMTISWKDKSHQPLWNQLPLGSGNW